MSEAVFYHYLLWASFALAAATFIGTIFITAPYGRHGAETGWGPKVSGTAAWILMETPAVLTMAVCFYLGRRPFTPTAIVFLAMWEFHYLHRTYVFPLRRRKSAKPMPLLVPLLAIAFNVMNGYLNGRYLFTFGPARDTSWFLDPRFLLGTAIFFAGFAINYQSDEILLHLRQPGETGYKIPRGGLYRWISSPNYFGEIIEWLGFALATWSPAGLAFALYSTSNLATRAVSHHKWYRQKFPDYPAERKAIIPYVC